MLFELEDFEENTRHLRVLLKQVRAASATKDDVAVRDLLRQIGNSRRNINRIVKSIAIITREAQHNNTKK